VSEFKEVTIKERKYRIGRFSAREGSWIIKLASKGASMIEQEYYTLLDRCLGLVSRYEALDALMPILASPGVFAAKDLEGDLSTVEKLKGEVMSFNFDSFLAERVRMVEELQKALLAQNSQSSNA
jgi:hypothetical protein